MGLLSWLFPSEADRLDKARALMAKGRYEDARRGLLHCEGPEAEALYDECSAAVDKADAASLKRQAHAAGFRGWRVDISMKDAGTRARLEALVARELEKAGIDLTTPTPDEEAVKAALRRAQQKAINKGLAGTAAMKLVPIMAGDAPPPKAETGPRQSASASPKRRR